MGKKEKPNCPTCNTKGRLVRSQSPRHQDQRIAQTQSKGKRMMVKNGKMVEVPRA